VTLPAAIVAALDAFAEAHRLYGVTAGNGEPWAALQASKAESDAARLALVGAILAALPSGEAVASALYAGSELREVIAHEGSEGYLRMRVDLLRRAVGDAARVVPLVPAAPAPVLTVGAALALPEVQDGSHWILVDDPPDGYSDGYRVRVAGMEASVCFDVDGMPGDEEEDWGGIGALNAHGFADPCRLAPVVAAVPDRYVLMPLGDVPPGTPPEHVALVPDEGQGEWYLAKLRAGEPRDVLTWSDVLTRSDAPSYTFAIVDTRPPDATSATPGEEVDRG
jgi:hypothetical protein